MDSGSDVEWEGIQFNSGLERGLEEEEEEEEEEEGEEEALSLNFLFS